MAITEDRVKNIEDDVAGHYAVDSGIYLLA